MLRTKLGHAALRRARLPLASLPVSVRLQSTTNALRPLDTYKRRHNGTSDEAEIGKMLSQTNSKSMADFISKVVPQDVLVERTLKVAPHHGLTESELLARVTQLANKNKVLKSLIGRGYYGTILPPVIQRNLLENPQWYTSYTPYQPEISQGRLESLMNFQTMVSELTGMEVANASLLDEATAASEAMIMAFTQTHRKKPVFYVDHLVFDQTLSVLKTRAVGLGIDVRVGLPKNGDYSDACGVLIQYPAGDGSIGEWKELTDKVHAAGGLVTVATDLLALTLIEPPASFGADIVFGSSQRFGVPMGFGGPHAAFFATRDSVKRKLPGRIVGHTIDRLGDDAFRLALQTREQHIRREKATSNICTAQALLANIAAMYAVYHGPEGLKQIAQRVYSLTTHLAGVIKNHPEFGLVNETWFDTLTVEVEDSQAFLEEAEEFGINVYRSGPTHVGISLDETVTEMEFAELCGLFGGKAPQTVPMIDHPSPRTSKFLQQDVFNKHHSETELLRYMNHLQSKDLSLANSMIPLGSCTMKLNATVQMMPVTFPQFSQLHPFVPLNQAAGYLELIKELEDDLSDITGFAATTVQPNSGAQGEFTGLRVIQAYHQSRGDHHRNVCLIPQSAHGTNPASAAMVGMKVVSVKTTNTGELDLADLEAKAEKFKDNLAAVMITYPSTYGAFEPGVRKAIDIIHKNGGQVYLDGANMNAQIGLTSPGDLGADVCHLNLHKTFCIPHGGGGPGVGPICVASHLAPFLPAHKVVDMPHASAQAIDSVSAAPWGSAGILSIPWAYIKLMGSVGLRSATELALLNANYMKERLASHYKILYTNSEGRCAHEFILDIRPFKPLGVEAIDVAKRLQDYGFHAPTMSWPVTNTLMIEPTESESLEELDRFCDALISIRKEIQDIEDGKAPAENGLLANAPHTQKDLLRSDWDRPYSREQAAYPLPYLKEKKFWPTITRVDDTYGDTHFCSCTPPEAK